MAEHEERNDFITGPKSRDGVVRSACTVPDTWAKDKENDLAEHTDNRTQRPTERCCPQCGEPISRHACPIAVKVVHDLYIAPGTSTADVLAEIGLGEEYSLLNREDVPFSKDHDIHAACLAGEDFFAVCDWDECDA